MKLLKLLVVIVCASSGAMSQDCPATQRYKITVDSVRHPVPAPPQDKALLFVVKDTEQLFTVGLSIDGHVAGANKAGTYFYVVLDAGEYSLCAGGQKMNLRPLPGFLTLRVDAGKTYFLEQQVETPLTGKDRIRLALLDEADGRAVVGRSRFSAVAKIKE